MAQWAITHLGNADAEISIPRRNLYKNPVDAGKSFAFPLPKNSLAYCSIRQANGTSSTSNGEDSKERKFEKIHYRISNNYSVCYATDILDQSFGFYSLYFYRNSCFLYTINRNSSTMNSIF